MIILNYFVNGSAIVDNVPGIAEIRVSFAILSGTSSSGMFSSHKQFLFPELLKQFMQYI